MTSSLFMAIYRRDLKLASRRRVDALLPVVFCVVASSLFPLGVGPEPQTLRAIAPGIVWVCALLAALLSLGAMYAGDHADGSLEQLLLADPGASVVAAAKAAAHWTLTGAPLVVAAPVLGLLFDLPAPSLVMLTFTLLLGTPVLSLLGSVGAALTLGLRSAGLLIVLIVLPLSIPALVFGTGAVSAVEGGQSPGGHLSLLGALLLFSLVGAPFAAAAALRIAMD